MGRDSGAAGACIASYFVTGKAKRLTRMSVVRIISQLVAAAKPFFAWLAEAESEADPEDA